MNDLLQEAASLLRTARHAIALTGAGMSTESGIPDFRSSGGVWSKYDPDEFSFQRFVSNPTSRKKYWRWGLEFYPQLKAAAPNAGHRALAAMEARGLLRCLITQNIDDLHRRAGSQNIIELHGNATRVGCLDCGKEWPRDEIQAQLMAGNEDPHCDSCGGLLKPKTISFGQMMPEAQTRRAFAEAGACDVLLVAGSSLVVYPAASLVPAARQAGASVILVNLEPTPYDNLARVAISGQCGEVLSGLLTLLDPRESQDV